MGVFLELLVGIPALYMYVQFLEYCNTNHFDLDAAAHSIITTDNGMTLVVLFAAFFILSLFFSGPSRDLPMYDSIETILSIVGNRDKLTFKEIWYAMPRPRQYMSREKADIKRAISKGYIPQGHFDSDILYLTDEAFIRAGGRP